MSGCSHFHDWEEYSIGWRSSKYFSLDSMDANVQIVGSHWYGGDSLRVECDKNKLGFTIHCDNWVLNCGVQINRGVGGNSKCPNLKNGCQADYNIISKGI
ncbi:hypothetical protein PIROE2DRAFT_10779 [Piromyces sp. E2]|nr:hypothetical protein PIROE2DRAFT_10779 [Piromyces sp. E2]|eukprot:OUM62854.1 hypothetical protein PIROE2DRAFT_10779 [Piromyces sp. E2]